MIRVQTEQLHVSPGHGLIRFVDALLVNDFLISVGNTFQTLAPEYWKDFNPLLANFLIGWIYTSLLSWWRHQVETFSVLLALCVGNSPVTCEFPAQRPVTRSFDIFFDLRLNKQLSKQSWGWWFETPSRQLWRHCNDYPLHYTCHRGCWTVQTWQTCNPDSSHLKACRLYGQLF